MPDLKMDWEALGAGIGAFVAGAGSVWAGMRKRLQASTLPLERLDGLEASLSRIEEAQTKIQVALISIGERALSLDEALTSGEPSRVEKLDALWNWTGAPGQDDTRVSRFTVLAGVVAELKTVTVQQAAISEQHLSLLRELVAALSGLREGKAG